jgi:hypothetical protein
MSPKDIAEQRTASGVRWLLLSLALAVVADLISDVPYYFGSAVPELNGLAAALPYRDYLPLLSLAVPAGTGMIGFLGMVRIEAGRGWTREARGERARPALFVAAAGAAFLLFSGLVLALVLVPIQGVWNPVRMTGRFVVILAVGVYLLETSARIDRPGSRKALAKAGFALGATAGAVRMLLAIHNGFSAGSAPPDFVTSQVEPLLAPAAFLLAVLSLVAWIAVYGRILNRLARERAARWPHPRAA